MLPGVVKVHLSLLIGKNPLTLWNYLTQEISTFGSKCPKTWSQIKISSNGQSSFAFR